MTHKELLKLFRSHDIDFVVVGGVALRLYNSPRVTHDIDLAVRTLDLDTIISLMYAHSYYLLTEVEADAVYLSLNERDAGQWIENVKTGSLSFIQPLQTPRQRRVAMEALDLSTQEIGRAHV